MFFTCLPDVVVNVYPAGRPWDSGVGAGWLPFMACSTSWFVLVGTRRGVVALEGVLIVPRIPPRISLLLLRDVKPDGRVDVPVNRNFASDSVIT